MGYRLDLVTQAYEHNQRTTVREIMLDDLDDLEPKALRSVIGRGRMLMLSSSPAGDVGFALDVKTMSPKDACAQCLAHGFCGAKPLYQVGFLFFVRTVDINVYSSISHRWTLIRV